MALLCYNKGCGRRFDPEENAPDACLHHPGFPIFHDALKGWSCCKKRTTDFSEFLSIQTSLRRRCWTRGRRTGRKATKDKETFGFPDSRDQGCTRGYHSHKKPPEAEEAVGKPDAKVGAEEVIVQGPKSAERMQRERPSSDEPKQLLPVKVSRNLEDALEKLALSPKEQLPGKEAPAREGAALAVSVGTSCKNSGCKVTYKGEEESNLEGCIFHPGVPVFHEGMKYWSCCGIKTTDFAAFLEQKGCSRGKHLWLKKQDKRLVSCRQDWHQTRNQVVVTLYAKTPLPEFSFVKANRTVLDIHIAFDGDKVYHVEIELWGVISPEESFVAMVPSKVEITLKKSSPLTWARLEHLQGRGGGGGGGGGEALPRQRQQQQQQQQEEKEALEAQETSGEPKDDDDDDDDDSLSWSEEEWEEAGGRAQEGRANSSHILAEDGTGHL